MTLDRREKLKTIFENTMQVIRNDSALSAATEKGMAATRLYEDGYLPALPLRPEQKAGIAVTKARTLEAAMRIRKKHPDWRVSALNFASATNPGGGVKQGSSAQEECLCRCTNLYPMLSQKRMWDGYYNKNRSARNPLHSDACIYSPQVTVLKTDEDYPRLMDEKDWEKVDIISCAAPNLRPMPGSSLNPEAGKTPDITPQELYDLHLFRAKTIMGIAVENGADALVLGAFGCGAFMNDPAVVAEAWRDAVQDMGDYFEYLEFAVFCKPHETMNYDVFRATITPSVKR